MANRDSEFRALVQQAHQAGLKALEERVPIPMVVSQHSNPLSDSSPVVKQYYVPEGACGFAWVKVRPGNSAFARWAKKNAGFRSSYTGGIDYWVSYGNQSIERKEAYAQAYADVLREAGIQAYAQSRLD